MIRLYQVYVPSIQTVILSVEIKHKHCPLNHRELSVCLSVGISRVELYEIPVSQIIFAGDKAAMQFVGNF